MTARTQRAPITLPLSVARPEHWTELALCAHPAHDSRWWDGVRDGEGEPDRLARQDRAKAVCARCTVGAECWAAIKPGDEGSIRAGVVVGRQRKHPSHNPEGRPVGPIRHGTSAGYSAHMRRDRLPCRPCTDAYNAHRQERRRRTA